MTRKPLVFTLAVGDFDIELLPESSRSTDSEEFSAAVVRFYESEFAPLGGRVDCTVRDGLIRVAWTPSGAVEDLFDEGTDLLVRGERRRGAEMLRALVAVEPRNSAALFNLGMALSDLGDLEEAKLHLVRLLHLEPDNINALVALGVALVRSGDDDGALRRLAKAVEMDPTNAYAQRNLGAVYGNLREGKRAIAHLSIASRLLPDDPMAMYGLAKALIDFGGPERRDEADQLFLRVIEEYPTSDLADLARTERTALAAATSRDAAGGMPRMDAVMYCLGALQRFDNMNPDEIRQVAIEIAILGTKGLDINSPDQKYTLKTLSGNFSGMHLVSIMYSAFKVLGLNLDTGMDLSREYASALQLHQTRTGR
jgi:tetratricopeptide (TPR) repeat protein